MYRIIDKRGTGKTSRLMLLAEENDGIIVCSNPAALIDKAKQYGFNGKFSAISYHDYFSHHYDHTKPIFIDELDVYIKSIDNNFIGYSLTNEDLL